MKVSKARMEEAVRLREAALRLLDQIGAEFTIEHSGSRHPARRGSRDGLSVLHSRIRGMDTIDVWQGPKVFSICWDDAVVEVIAFRLGAWRDALLGIGANPTEARAPRGYLLH